MSLFNTHNEKETFIVTGYTREIKVKAIIPNEMITLITSYSHNEFNHLYNLSGNIDRIQLQRQILKEIKQQTGLRPREIHNLQERNVKNTLVQQKDTSQYCSHVVQILNVSDANMFVNQYLYGRRNTANLRNHCTQFYTLKCITEPHWINDISCIAMRFNTYETLKKKDTDNIDCTSKNDRLSFFRRIYTKTSRNIQRYTVRNMGFKKFRRIFKSEI
eukprot:447047_1